MLLVQFVAIRFSKRHHTSSEKLCTMSFPSFHPIVMRYQRFVSLHKIMSSSNHVMCFNTGCLNRACPFLKSGWFVCQQENPLRKRKYPMYSSPVTVNMHELSGLQSSSIEPYGLAKSNFLIKVSRSEFSFFRKLLKHFHVQLLRLSLNPL